MRVRTVSLKTNAHRDRLFLCVDGIKIAERGRPNSPHAKTWIPEPGWSVIDGADGLPLIEEEGR